MINCDSLIADQLVSKHQCSTLEGGAEPPSLGCPPPLFPRVHLPPIIPSRQTSDVLVHRVHVPNPRRADDVDDFGSAMPPVLPPRERCDAETASSSIPVPPPRLVHLSPSPNNKAHCDFFASRKTKPERSSKETLEFTSNEQRGRLDKFSCPGAVSGLDGDLPTGFGIEPLFSSSLTGSANVEKRFTRPGAGMRPRAGLQNPAVSLKTCTGNKLETVRSNGGTVSRTSNASSSLFSNQVVPLSQWPIPVIVIPASTHSIQNAEDRISFEWVGPKKVAVANEYVEAPSLQSPSQNFLEHSDSISPSLDVLVVTSQPIGSSAGKDWRNHHAKSDGLRGDGGPTPLMRDLSCASNGEKAFDFSSSSSSRGHPLPPCKKALVCSRCKKCRCDGCTRPRKLPRKWIGPAGRQCACSADEAVRICSCLCCVQTIFYHCFFHPDDDYDPVVDPCACCESEKCCLRWSLMAALLPVLPCLCCYCPLQCSVDALSYCYDSCNSRGCRCRGREWNGASDLASGGCDRPTSSTSSSGATRDLVVESESSSA